jgi:hypothetical protein
MGQKVFLVHGWSVQETTTYQALHLQLAKNGYQLEEIFLGRYVSLEDKVEIGDIARALDLAMAEKLADDWSQTFHIITHSTGALVVRHWIAHHYTTSNCCRAKPLQNVIFLAGPHFGSRLAHHGRSMLAHARYLGDTGEQILNALELGSAFSWQLGSEWLDEALWRRKGIRLYCLIGDRVQKSFADRLSAAVFPAAFERGSDMVVRCAAGNLNFARYELDARDGKLHRVGGIEGVPFAALADYVHSGDKNGIMNSIKRRSVPATHQSLRLILRCLGVADDEDYAVVADELRAVTAATREKRPGFAQLDFRFRDDTGEPIDDYVFKLGWLDPKGRELPSEAVCHTHKNRATPSHFTAFIEMRRLETAAPFFIEFDSESNSRLFSYQPDPFRIGTDGQGDILAELVREDRTTQIDVVLSREPSRNLFAFHRGDDGDLHVRWNREGEVVEKGLEVK